MTAFFWIGASATAILFATLFARRYPGRTGWIVAGVVIGLVAMLVWPVTLWIAVAMWLTGFTRRNAGRRRIVVFPLAAVGSFATILVFGALAGPAPQAARPTAPVALAEVAAPTTSAAPTTIPPSTTTPAPTTTAAPTTTTAPPTTTSRPTTTTPRPVVTTTPSPEPQPRPAPKPQPKPQPKPSDDGDDSGTRRHTGNTGHPCLPGERDGDNDGYCGEGR